MSELLEINVTNRIMSTFNIKLSLLKVNKNYRLVTLPVLTHSVVPVCPL